VNLAEAFMSASGLFRLTSEGVLVLNLPDTGRGWGVFENAICPQCGYKPPAAVAPVGGFRYPCPVCGELSDYHWLGKDDPDPDGGIELTVREIEAS